MRIRTKKEVNPNDNYPYSLRFSFDKFTEEEKYLFNKYGFLSIDTPHVLVEVGKERDFQSFRQKKIDQIAAVRFLFGNKQALISFEKKILSEIQKQLKRYNTYLKDLSKFAGEETYEVTAAGEIRKINEGAKKALDKNSKEYKETIEKNREAFEKLSKL
ncbi:MAG TPA: hypothetical protein VII11_04910 [Bacteroidota bacterium]